jgi:BlaI family transcriptional regulator, penicillinase repressor
MSNYKEPSKLEMQVLSVLWKRGPLTVRDILDSIPDGKNRAYTTVLSVMQVMEKKGLLTHTAQGNTHIYKAQVSRKEVAGPVLQSLVRHVFGGAATAFQHLLNEKSVSQSELEEIKRLIAEHDKADKEKSDSKESKKRRS